MRVGADDVIELVAADDDEEVEELDAEVPALFPMQS